MHLRARELSDSVLDVRNAKIVDRANPSHTNRAWRATLALSVSGPKATYIANWLDVLTADNRAIFAAASHAQRAADFINGRQRASIATTQK
jgi:antirestriction protein ArdC